MSFEDRLLDGLRAREPQVRFGGALIATLGFWPLVLALLALLQPQTPVAAVPVLAAVVLGLAGIPLGSLILAEGYARDALSRSEPARLALPGLIVLTGVLPTAVLVADLGRASMLGTGDAAAANVGLLLLWTLGFVGFAWDLTKGRPPWTLATAGLMAPVLAIALSWSFKAIIVSPLVFPAVLAAWRLVAWKAPHLLSGDPMPTAAAPNTLTVTCSFCGKDQVAVKKLIAGPNVAICDECIDLSNDILREETEKVTKAAPPTMPGRADRDALRAALAAAFPGAPQVTEALASTLFVHRARAAGAATRPARVLIVGPTGCGKSSLLSATLAAANLPHAHTEATRLTETGYVGECVENLLAELVDAAGSVETASFGVLAIDGLHHLTRRGPSMTGRDISGGEVQRELLRLLDGRAAPLSYTRPRHPQQDHPRFPADRVLILAAATVPADAPTDEPALRSWLVAEGYSPELIARFERVVFVPALDATRAALRLRAPDGPLAPLFALARVMDVELRLSDATIKALADLATGSGGGWNVAAAIARLTHRVVEAYKRLSVDALE